MNQIPDPASGAAPANEPRDLRLPPGSPPTRRSARGRRWAAVGASLAWLAAHLAVYGVRQDFGQLSPAYIAAQIVLPVAFGACCLVVALAPGKLGLGLGVGLVSTMALLGPLLFWVLALGMPVPYASAGSPLGFWVSSMLCLDITLAWAAAPLLVVALATRRAFATQAVGRSALLGAALGLLSGAAINLHCPNVDPWHMLAGHGVPVAVAALVGGLLVVRWARA